MAEGIDSDAAVDNLEEAVHTALLLGMRDIFLKELFELAVREGIAESLLQAAVSNLPVTPSGLAQMLADENGDLGDVTAARDAIDRLADLSLVHRFPDGSVWVHRWTAEGLANFGDAALFRARCTRAGRYRMWRAEHETHSLNDGIEAVRNFLSGEDFDAAAESAIDCLDALNRFNQSVSVAALASEVLEKLPEGHSLFAPIADREAQAHLALGFTDRARERYQRLMEGHERLAAGEPDRADYQRDLSLLYNKLGDLYRALGQGEQAREAYSKSLAIRER
ncbi:MAG TPA: tetratricopeptide repeat protein, partial [Candidatus Sulfotelmatobacter sp.]|nr:tetratricopeptide repeat protein [Candidatus Sulfotelmatobacter sp.]